MKFITALEDLGQPYSCTQWGNQGINGVPVIVEHDGDIFSWFHDSWSAYPTYVLIDHTMTVRAKPWTYENNSNNSSCDGTNNSVDGWSGGNANNFLQQLVDECGDLCIENMCEQELGDVNEDGILNIQDVIGIVNHILATNILFECSLEAADVNVDGNININDLISVINLILGNSRTASLEGSASIDFIRSEKDLILLVNSTVDILGVQLSFINQAKSEIILKDNSHIKEQSSYLNEKNRYIAYSQFNQPFESNIVEFKIINGSSINDNLISIILSDINGDLISVDHHSTKNYEKEQVPYSFAFTKIYPNPFNASTEIQFTLPSDGFVSLSAYNLAGKEVDIIFEGFQSTGRHNYKWNAFNIPSGVYYIKLKSENKVQIAKTLLIK